MAQNISKYVQLNDFLLLEYEFNRDGVLTNLSFPTLALTNLGSKQYFDAGSIGVTNNSLELQSVPINSKRSEWYENDGSTQIYFNFFDSSALISQADYPHDTVRVHIISGYNFDDIGGFLLQVRAEDVSGNLVDMSNFTWVKQIQGNSVIKFAVEPLYLGNKFYDKYTELKIPSIQNLGGASIEPIEASLGIKLLSDVYLQYSTITEINNFQYLISEKIQVQLPVISNADNFNCYMAESTSGDYIEYYATWNNTIIGEYMGDIESGRIPLFTSNNPNDNFQEFSDQYGTEAAKWVIIHEIQVYEHIPPGTTLLTQRFQFTQSDNFMSTNKFRPIIVNSDISSSYSIDYICRLTNRMDGSQIIRKASFSSTDPKKYGRYFNRINVDNYIPYKVFNKLPAEKANIVTGSSDQRTKFTKVFYDTTNVVLNTNNEVLPQGTGPMFLKNGDSTYKFKFERLNTNTNPSSRENVDLSGVYNYAILFVLDDLSKIEISPTFSTNMNTTLGELEFKLLTEQISTLLTQTNNTFSIVVKNPDGTQYTFYEGLFYSLKDFNQVIAQYKELFNVNSLNNTIADLEAQVKTLQDENAILKQG
jgi:hypothetical protein